MQILKEQGGISFRQLSDICVPSVSEEQVRSAEPNKIKDYLRIFDVESSSSIKIQATKKSLSEKKPVVIGMICPPSFNGAKDVWMPTEEALNSYGGHAMCGVG